VKKKIIVAKSKELKTGSDLAESSKKGYDSKMAVLPTVTMMRRRKTEKPGSTVVRSRMLEVLY
jgi:hypothetical protein